MKTNQSSRSFGSDNHASIHPQILQAIVDANHDHAPSYGTDPLSQDLQTEIVKIFGPRAEGFLVFNGTGANVTALKCLVKSYHSVIATEISHLQMDECGAPEAIIGCKILTVPHVNGKLNISDLERLVVRRGDQHSSQIGALSLTQPTELGTCYEISELKNIIAWARAQGLKIHIDGARFTGAAHFLKTSLADLSDDLGIDILSFGGTKNGLLFGELVIIFNEQLARDFRYIRKQCLQLPSKTRFMAAQFLTYFKNDLWREIAAHSHEMAQLLAQELKSQAGVEADFPVQSNAVFVTLPRTWIKTLKTQNFFYVWDEHTFQCRLMTSWDTRTDDVHGFVAKVVELQQQNTNGDGQ